MKENSKKKKNGKNTYLITSLHRPQLEGLDHRLRAVIHKSQQTELSVEYILYSITPTMAPEFPTKKCGKYIGLGLINHILMFLYRRRICKFDLAVLLH